MVKFGLINMIAFDCMLVFTFLSQHTSLSSGHVFLAGMSKSNHPTSVKSVSSLQSIASVGIGNAALTAIADLPRPLPEGVLSSNEPVYDCIVYLIYCPTHDNVAVTNLNKCKCVWLPFVPLPDGETWIKASHDGVDILIGRNDPEMEAEDAERQAPIYKMNYLHIQRLQLPSKKTILRLSQFVYLEPNPNFQCCRNTDRVNWLAVVDIQQNRISPLWGPELKILTTMLTSTQRQVVSEFTCVNALYYLNLHGSKQQEILTEAKLMSNHVYEIYSDFVEHCHPAFYMGLESFRVYFLKFGLNFDSAVLDRLFNAFQLTEEKRSFLDFHEFLIGLVAFEPTCSNQLELRIRFIFKYYDYEKKDQLNASNVYTLLKDACPSWPDQKINEELRVHMANKSILSYEDFVAAFQSKFNNQLYALCRAPSSILRQISSLLSSKMKERLQSKQACQGLLKAKRITKGTCWSCRAQQYEYGSQCVTIDTVGRCVEPTMIPVMPPPSSKHSINRSRYSVECVFSVASVPNIFIDLIRDFHAKRCNVNRLAGLMTTPQEWYIFQKYLRILCNELAAMLDNEKKLVKINGPAIVVGDLHGNLNDLIHLERLFWQSFPVMSENLVYLGNYSGKFGHSMECIIYLFSLKLCSPNKVHLLRGASELGSETSSSLQQECTRKFGAEHGKLIAGIFLQVFAKLPITVLIDENILCTHSGIPTAPRLEPLAKLPKDMPALLRDSPLAHEIVTRYPKGDSSKSPSSRTTSKSTKSLSKANVSNVLFGGKVGDTRFHTDFKSNSARKSKSRGRTTKPSSAKSLRTTSRATNSAPLAQKSGKSLLKSLRIKSTKSLKSLETKSGKLTQLPKPKSADSMRTTTSGKSLSQSTRRDYTNQLQISIPKSGRSKMKPTFLKSRKTQRKSVKLKTRSKSPRSKSSKFPATKKQSVSVRGRNTFDRHEFRDFMKANDLSFFIRSSSACKLGFKINFSQQCLTVFSCSNFNSQNQAAVALVDGSAFSIRFLRYKTTPNNTPNNQTTK